MIFSGIKACLDKKDDEMIHDKLNLKVSIVKEKLEERTLFSYLSNCYTSKQETFMQQKDFAPFVRLFYPAITDTEVNELAQSYSRKDKSLSISLDLAEDLS